MQVVLRQECLGSIKEPRVSVDRARFGGEGRGAQEIPTSGEEESRSCEEVADR